MFENIIKFFKKIGKHEVKETNSKEKAKERLHLVLMQDRANVSADFLELMKQEIMEVIKKYIEVAEDEIDVRMTNEVKEDGTTGSPFLYANIPILNIRNDKIAKNEDMKKVEENTDKKGDSGEEDGKQSVEESKEEKQEENKQAEEEKKVEDEQENKKEIKEEKEEKAEQDSKEKQEKAEEDDKEKDSKEEQEEKKEQKMKKDKTKKETKSNKKV